MTWANVFRAVWKRLWRSAFRVSTANLDLISEVGFHIADSMKQKQLRAATEPLERLQSLRAQIVATHKNDPTRAKLENMARQTVNLILSDGVRK